MVSAKKFTSVSRFTRDTIARDSRNLRPELVSAIDSCDLDDENNNVISIVSEAPGWCDVQAEDLTLLVRARVHESGLTPIRIGVLEHASASPWFRQYTLRVVISPVSSEVVLPLKISLRRIAKTSFLQALELEGDTDSRNHKA